MLLLLLLMLHSWPSYLMCQFSLRKDIKMWDFLPQGIFFSLVNFGVGFEVCRGVDALCNEGAIKKVKKTNIVAVIGHNTYQRKLFQKELWWYKRINSIRKQLLTILDNPCHYMKHNEMRVNDSFGSSRYVSFKITITHFLFTFEGLKIGIKHWGCFWFIITLSLFIFCWSYQWQWNTP